MEYAKRKSPRISYYDYSLPNYYFITICTHNKKCIFGKPNQLNDCGEIARKSMEQISDIYPQVRVDKYTVMPNHVHAIIVLSGDMAVGIPHIIGQYKMSVTKHIRSMYPDMMVWQRSFHDHIIRNQKSYERIWEYIHNNPAKWEEDCFYNRDALSIMEREGQCPSPTE